MHKHGCQLNYLHCKKKKSVLTQNVTHSLRCTKTTVVRFQTRMLRHEFIEMVYIGILKEQTFKTKYKIFVHQFTLNKLR
jgi:hypothetical protein